MSTRTRTKCSGCHKRIPRSEPDLMLRKDGSEKVRYYHERCFTAAQRVVLSDPALWWMTHRYVDGELN